MKTIFILLSLFTLASCGAKRVQHTKLSIHPAALPYIKTFEERDGQKIKDLVVTFAKDSEPNRLGYCSKGERVVRKPSGNGFEDHVYATPIIVINTDYWNSPSFTVAEKEQLMYHELGHCIKGLGHSKSVMSIMYAYALGASQYLAYYSSYMAEFFSNKSYASASAKFDGSAYALTANNDYVEDENEEMIHPEGEECVHDHGTVVEMEESDEV